MVNSSIGHLQFNVQPENLAYYRDLLSFLGWQVLYDVEGMVGMGDPERQQPLVRRRVQGSGKRL